MRAEEAAEGPPTHVIVLATLGAPERRRLARRRREAQRDAGPAPVTTGRATVIDVAQPFAGPAEAAAWLAAAGEPELEAGLAVLNGAIHAFRLVTGDPYVGPVGRHHCLVARIGYGAGEQVADGQWADAVELLARTARQTRARVLAPQAALAAVLGGRERRLVCEDLILRGRLDLDAGREREAALQLLVALDAAIAELSVDRLAPRLAERLDELRGLRDGVAEAGQQALAGPLDAAARESVGTGINRVESILRARAVMTA